jgi:hypothetical protein
MSCKAIRCEGGIVSKLYNLSQQVQRFNNSLYPPTPSPRSFHFTHPSVW